LVKGVALLALAIVALVTALPEAAIAPHDTMAHVMPQGLALAAGLVVALQSAIYTYDGWTGPIYFGEEIRDPGRELPRSMIGGVVLVLAIYLALNLAFLRVLGIEAMAGDPFVAATAAARLFGAGGDTVLRILMIISLIAAVNALQLMASRIPHAMSGDGLLPALMGRVNRGGTPVPSLLAGSVLTLVFVISGTFDAVLALLAFFFVANYVLTFISLFVQRRRRPDIPRPFRVPGYPLVPLLALGSSVFFLAMAIWGDRSHSLMAIGLLAVAWPVYYVQSRFRQRSAQN
ncbi:MAG: amino acid permease, partial [Dokdonella sp.]